MAGYWEKTDPSRRLTSASEAEVLREVSLEEAQGWTNFVVFTPRWLPRDTKLGATTVRVEQPPGRPEGVSREALGQTPWSVANPCSLRTVVEGSGRSLRIKQFLYDWAPAAASIAPLWDSARVEPFRCQSTVAWTATDYRNMPGACVQLLRTQIELSVVEGEFTPTELVDLLNGMEVANEVAARDVMQAPFHRLSYWVRYRFQPYKVPYGLFRYANRRMYEYARVLDSSELSRVESLRVLLPGSQDFVIDSAVMIEHEPARHREVEVLVRRADGVDDAFWMVAMGRDSEWALEIPPAAEDRGAELREERHLRETTINLAALTRKYGAWEAFWEEGDVRYAVWATASPRMQEEGFVSFLCDLG